MCDPITAIAVTATGVGAYGQYKAGRDQREAYQKQAISETAYAESQREIARYNADILQQQALRLRNEQVGRINEVAGINIQRLAEAADINIGRTQRARTTNVSRLIQDTGTNIDRVEAEAERNLTRVRQVAEDQIDELRTQANLTREVGAESENDRRQQTADDISDIRASYGARNVVIDSGTPASLQVDAARMGEVEALRIRRNYRMDAERYEREAMRTAREANWEMEDIARSRDEFLTDSFLNMGRQVSDLNLAADDWISDIRRTTDYQIGDIRRNLGYDLSDTEFEAKKFDQQAALAILQGDAEYTAGLNRSDAYGEAGSDAYTAGILNSASTIAAGINPKWFNPKSAANQR